MQLWQMLARKVSNLGRVVDGARNSSMDAKRAEDGTTVGGGISGQDELQSFFADNVYKDDRREVASKKVPVKGTILSFFAKQKEEQTPQKGESGTTFKQPPITTPKRKAVEWDCHVCTFHNFRVPPKIGWLACEMCGTEHSDFDRRMDSEDNLISEVTPASGRNQGKPSAKLKEVETIIIIDDSENNDRLQAHTPKSIDNEYFANDYCRPGNSREKKRQKVFHESGSLPIKVYREKDVVTRSLVKETNPSLSFTVSKNTGRISVFWGSGTTSFQVEDIVTQETSDRMIEAKLSRQHRSNVSIPLVYKNSALEIGMYNTRHHVFIFVGCSCFSNTFCILCHPYSC
jgi:hypothetical protein